MGRVTNSHRDARLLSQKRYVTRCRLNGQATHIGITLAGTEPRFQGRIVAAAQMLVKRLQFCCYFARGQPQSRRYRMSGIDPRITAKRARFSGASVLSALAEKSSSWQDSQALSLTLPGIPGFTRSGLWGALSEEQFWRVRARKSGPEGAGNDTVNCCRMRLGRKLPLQPWKATHAGLKPASAREPSPVNQPIKE